VLGPHCRKIEGGTTETNTVSAITTSCLELEGDETDLTFGGASSWAP